MSNVTYVFDVDDTICRHKNRDYANAEPIVPDIDKIRELRENGCTIVLYTARGQVSCKGDISLIEERNRDILETWLKRHDVPYDKLLFGKPLGDFYVDDKAVNLEDFLAKKQQKLTSGSGATVTTDGNTVVKKANNVHEQNSWYNIVKGSSQNIPVPKVKSLVVDTRPDSWHMKNADAAYSYNSGDCIRAIHINTKLLSANNIRYLPLSVAGAEDYALQFQVMEKGLNTIVIKDLMYGMSGTAATPGGCLQSAADSGVTIEERWKTLTENAKAFYGDHPGIRYTKTKRTELDTIKFNWKYWRNQNEHCT